MELESPKSNYNIIRQVFFPILSGLLTSQVIAYVFVYHSNQHILSSAKAMEKAGFFSVPAGNALASLDSFGAAFGGGLFYTLSVGVGLTLLTWSACYVLQLLSGSYNWMLKALGDYGLPICGIIWVALLMWVTLNGLALFPILFCLVVPAVTAGVYITAGKPAKRLQRNLWYIPTATLLLLTLVWTAVVLEKKYQLDLSKEWKISVLPKQHSADLFIQIRDQILLSNPAGRNVNNFYYHYTLFAAEAFKSFNQKMLRTCQLEGFEDEARRQKLVKHLQGWDVLAITGLEKPDLRLIHSKGTVRLLSSRGDSHETDYKTLLTDTRNQFKAFSENADRYKQFRRLTFFGLLIGFPILLFIFSYGLFRIGSGLVLEENKSVWAASGICLLIGLLLLLPMLRASPARITTADLNAALTSFHWSHRVAALRLIHKQKIEISRYPAYLKMVKSPLMVERYYLARALAKSRVPSTYGHLMTLLKDPHPNVICQALYALGERKQRGAVSTIKHKIVSLDHWYAQRYGYQALRKLGWRQGQ